MNKKGQALVEFVIILPVFILLVLGIIDIGKILLNQNTLEHKLDDVITKYEDTQDEDELESFLQKDDKLASLDISYSDDLIEFKISKELEIITPGLNLIFKNPYKLEVKRVIYNE